EWIDTAVRKNPANVKKIRLTLTAGNSSFWAGYATKPRIIIIVTDYSLPKNPFRLMVSPFRIDEKSPFRTIKTLSFIIEMTSRKKAYATGFDDALLLNRAGNVAETSSANIFWANQGNLYTPPLSAGCLNGMTRKHILRIAKENNITAYERNIKLKNLLSAQEIFITSSLKLILPVVNIQAEKSFRYKAGKLTNRLQQLLLDDIMGVK
ncbi:MAG: aminotransferase class IV, partial [candidate division Zixibacteria bacterium]|nr:aminotransferase class IV [candidate division Zixibacteria bacterium]